MGVNPIGNGAIEAVPSWMRAVHEILCRDGVDVHVKTQRLAKCAENTSHYYQLTRLKQCDYSISISIQRIFV